MSHKLLRYLMCVVFSGLALQAADVLPALPEIEITRDGKTKIIKFTPLEVSTIKKDFSALSKKLKAEGIECCAPRKRLSKCIWECCDRTQVKTCDEVLRLAFEQLMKSERSYE